MIKKKLFFLIFIIFLSKHCLYSWTLKDSSKISSNFERAKIHYFEKDIAKALTYINFALKEAKIIADKELIAFYHYHKAIFYIEVDKIKEALNELSLASSLFSNNNVNYNNIIFLKTKILIIKNELFNAEKLLINISIPDNYTENKFQYLLLLSEIKLKQKQLEKAKIILKQLTKIHSKIKSKLLIAYYLKIKGEIHYNLKNFKDSKDSFKEALQIFRDKKRYYSLAYCLTKIGFIYNKTENKIESSNYLFLAAQSFYSNGFPKKAKKILIESLKINNNIPKEYLLQSKNLLSKIS